jgi:hypothetical protein
MCVVRMYARTHSIRTYVVTNERTKDRTKELMLIIHARFVHLRPEELQYIIKPYERVLVCTCELVFIIRIQNK